EHFRYFGLVQTAGGPAVELHPPGEPARVYPLARCRFYQTADTATKIKKENDFTVVGTFCLCPGRELLVWDVFRAKIEVPYQFGTLIALRSGPHRWVPEARRAVVGGGSWPLPLLFQAVEDASSGIGLIQQGLAEGRPFKVIKTDGDKVQKS